MNLAELFIRRPIATTLVMIGILIFGLMSYRLPISDLPSVDYPTIQVSASRPGASPETMAKSVARPLESSLPALLALISQLHWCPRQHPNHTAIRPEP
jgi:HAE1 family hydrophobic/amphiphilic exporter-1